MSYSSTRRSLLVAESPDAVNAPSVAAEEAPVSSPFDDYVTPSYLISHKPEELSKQIADTASASNSSMLKILLVALMMIVVSVTSVSNGVSDAKLSIGGPSLLSFLSAYVGLCMFIVHKQFPRAKSL